MGVRETRGYDGEALVLGTTNRWIDSLAKTESGWNVDRFLLRFRIGREELIDFLKTLAEDHRASPRMHNARQVSRASMHRHDP